jgi:betaine-aldehyde dehydrogenase
MIEKRLNLIGGRFVPSCNGETLSVESPSTREVIAEIPRSRSDDVDGAVRAARAALEGWGGVPIRERAAILTRAADELEAESEHYAQTIAGETGNAIRTQARGEVRLAVDLLRYYGAATAETFQGRTMQIRPGVFDYDVHEPIGVIGAITPWNAPVGIAVGKVAPAIVAGNTVVLKPAEDAPLAASSACELIAAKLPPGVVNIVMGLGEESGAALANHADVDMVSFTGSTEVGRIIMHAAAGRIARIALELGGKSPQIVFPDALSDQTVQGAIDAMRFTRQGQSCTAGSRLFIHREIYDEFLERMVERLDTFVVGDPLDEATDMGAIINAKQFDRVCSYVAEGLEQHGARLLTGGSPADRSPSDGFFHRPTVIADVDPAWRVAREEIFGPVVCAVPWTDEDEVLRLANDSSYGLGAYVWTRNVGAALRAASRIESGWVQVNQGGGQSPGQSYGGFKQSGIGKEMSHEAMVGEFTQVKHVSVNMSDLS